MPLKLQLQIELAWGFLEEGSLKLERVPELFVMDVEKGKGFCSRKCYTNEGSILIFQQLILRAYVLS